MMKILQEKNVAITNATNMKESIRMYFRAEGDSIPDVCAFGMNIARVVIKAVPEYITKKS